jgi:hypothetical protein
MAGVTNSGTPGPKGSSAATVLGAPEAGNGGATEGSASVAGPTEVGPELPWGGSSSLTRG